MAKRGVGANSVGANSVGTVGVGTVSVGADRSMTPVPADQGFRGSQVCTLVGITYRQLDYWARTDLLRPSITDATGSGSQRRYSYGDVLELKVIKRLLDAGLKLQQARQAVECLRGDLGADLASSQLVLVDNRSVLARSNGDIVDLLAGAQGVFNILPLSGVVSELDAAIVAIDAASEPAPTSRPVEPFAPSEQAAEG